MKRYTFRFANHKVAQQAARALRRRGFEAGQHDNDATVLASSLEGVHHAFRARILRRRAVPFMMLVDVQGEVR